MLCLHLLIKILPFDIYVHFLEIEYDIRKGNGFVIVVIVVYGISSVVNVVRFDKRKRLVLIISSYPLYNMKEIVSGIISYNDCEYSLMRTKTCSHLPKVQYIY